MMDSNNLIIKTKLFPPASRISLIERLSLPKVLGSIRTKQLALVHAPAGYGKTTLLSQWHKSLLDNGQTTCWLSLDELDDDPTIFVRYVLCAFQEALSDFWVDADRWMESRLQPDITVTLNHIINELLRLDKPIILFIDDYHHINSVDIHQFIDRLIDWSPETFLLVLGSRVVPSISLSKWRVREEMIEVDVSMLRFNVVEATTFLERKHELELTPDQISLVIDKSEGWAAGLQLVALGLKNHDERDGFIASFSGNLYEIADYLTNNVLVQQSLSLTNFLLKTSILSRFNADICNLLTGRNDSQSILEQLESDGLFTLSVDAGGHWYRYHHLFQDFLISRLRRQYPYEVFSLYHKAAGWFRKKGLVKEAVDYALLSNDLEIIENIHRDAIAIMSLMGTTPQVYTWLRHLPEAVKDQFPRLLILEGFALCLMNKVQNAEIVNARLEQALAELANNSGHVDPEELRSLKVEAVVVPASIAAMKDDYTHLLELTEQLGDKPVNNLMVAVLSDLRGYAQFRQGHFTDSKVLLERAWQYFSLNKQSYGMAVVDCYAGIANFQLLNYQEAYRLFERAEEAGLYTGSGNIFASALASTMRGTVYYEWNRLKEAQLLLNSNLSLLEEIGPPIFPCYGYVTLSRCYSAEGDWDAANNALNRCLIRSRHCLSNFFTAWVERERLLLGTKIFDSGATYSNLDNHPVFNIDAIPKYWDIADYFSLANQVRIGILQNNVDGARMYVVALREYAQKHRATQAVLDSLLLEAKVLKLQDAHIQAVGILQQAVELAKSSGLLRTFVDEGQTIKELLVECSKLKSINWQVASYIDEILNIYTVLGEDFTAKSMSTRVKGHLVQVEALSNRELEVLQLMTTGQTNIEIAGQLHIAQATVKFHVGNIFSKLNVTNRTLAVATARNSGLIS